MSDYVLHIDPGQNINYRNLNMRIDIEFEKDDILYHTSRPVVYAKIRRLAKELAVLGKINIASEITDLLLSQNRIEHGFSQMRFLNFAFEQTGDWPSAISESARSESALLELEITHSGPIEEDRYVEIINQTEPSIHDLALCLNIAVGLCEERGVTDVQDVQQDERVVRVLDRVTKNFQYCYETLIQYRRIWPLLASGILAQRLGIKDATLCAMACEMVEVIRIRMKEGRQKSPYEGRPTRELLQILVQNTRKHAGTLYEHRRESPPESYLHKPATEKEIEDLENRLQIPRLPDDYREFLQISNGLEPVYMGGGLTLPLFSTQNIKLQEQQACETVELQLVHDPNGTAQMMREYGYREWPTACNQIEIGRVGELVYTLSGPSDVEATVKAYKEALSSDKVTDAIKFETLRGIEEQYGSLRAFEKMEWIMLYTEEFTPVSPIGTFRLWLEETARFSGTPYTTFDGDSEGDSYYCLAYDCMER